MSNNQKQTSVPRYNNQGYSTQTMTHPSAQIKMPGPGLDNYHIQTNQYGPGATPTSNPNSNIRTIPGGQPPSTASTPPQTQDMKIMSYPMQQNQILLPNPNFVMPFQYSSTRPLMNQVYHGIAPQPQPLAYNHQYYNHQQHASQLFLLQSNPLNLQRTQQMGPIAMVGQNNSHAAPAPSHTNLPQPPLFSPMSQPQVIQQSTKKNKTKRKHCLQVINPKTGEDIINECFSNDGSETEDANERQTPNNVGGAQNQGNNTQSAPTTNHDVANEFALKVAKVLSEESNSNAALDNQVSAAPTHLTNQQQQPILNAQQTFMVSGSQPAVNGTPQVLSHLPTSVGHLPNENVIHTVPTGGANAANVPPTQQLTNAAQLMQPQLITGLNAANIPQPYNMPTYQQHYLNQPQNVVDPQQTLYKYQKKNDSLVIDSKLQASTKEFTPLQQQVQAIHETITTTTTTANNSKLIETPVVSANADCAEVTIQTNSQNKIVNKDRDSPIKQQRKQQRNIQHQQNLMQQQQQQMAGVPTILANNQQATPQLTQSHLQYTINNEFTQSSAMQQHKDITMQANRGQNYQPQQRGPPAMVPHLGAPTIAASIVPHYPLQDRQINMQINPKQVNQMQKAIQPSITPETLPNITQQPIIAPKENSPSTISVPHYLPQQTTILKNISPKNEQQEQTKQRQQPQLPTGKNIKGGQKGKGGEKQEILVKEKSLTPTQPNVTSVPNESNVQASGKQKAAGNKQAPKENASGKPGQQNNSATPAPAAVQPAKVNNVTESTKQQKQNVTNKEQPLKQKETTKQNNTQQKESKQNQQQKENKQQQQKQENKQKENNNKPVNSNANNNNTSNQQKQNKKMKETKKLEDDTKLLNSTNNNNNDISNIKNNNDNKKNNKLNNNNLVNVDTTITDKIIVENNKNNNNVDIESTTTIQTNSEKITDLVVENVVPVSETNIETLQTLEGNATKKQEVLAVDKPVEIIDKLELAKKFFTYPYREGQYTPFNPNGEKRYLREYLIELKNDPKSKIKPTDIPSELILGFNKPTRLALDPSKQWSGMGMRQYDVNLMPSYAKSSSQRGQQGQQPLMSRKSQQGNKIKIGNLTGSPIMPMLEMNKTKVISLSLNETVKLHETENAWKPQRLQSKKELTEEEIKSQELYKKFRGYLNKLTPEKFKILLDKALKLEIKTETQLKEIIDIAFEKAIDEPNFAKLYAEFCRDLTKKSVISDTEIDANGQPEIVSFRKALITRCQRMFEKIDVDESKRNNKIIEIEKIQDTEKKKEAILELEEDDRGQRMKAVGNVQFIGELFMLQMLTVKIMGGCIEFLLKKINEEDLECLCKLLTTVGKDLELKHFDLEPTFKKMQDIVDKKPNPLSSRIRFMLQNLIDLRKNKWVPRRQDNKPKTIDQIKKEADTEQLNMQLSYGPSQSLTAPRSNKDDRMFNTSQGTSIFNLSANERKKHQMDENGWTKTTRGSSTRNNNYSVDVNKIKLSNNNKGPTEQMPLGQHGTFSKWSRGSNTPKATELETGSNMFSSFSEMKNPYSILLDSYENNEKNQSLRNNRDPYISKGSSLEKRWNEGGSGSRSGSQHRSREGSLARQYTPSQPPTISSPLYHAGMSQSLNYPIQKTTTMPAPTSQPVSTVPTKENIEEINEEALKIKIKKAIDEMFSCYNILDQCFIVFVDNIRKSEFKSFVYEGICLTFDRTEKQRVNFGNILAQLIRSSKITMQALCDGLLQFYDDIEYVLSDYPKFWDYLAEILYPLLAEGALSLVILRNTSGKIINMNKGGEFLTKLFTKLAKSKSESFAAKLWQESGCQITDFIVSKDISADKLLKDYNLEFLMKDYQTDVISNTNSNSNNKSANSETLDFYHIESNLLDIFSNSTNAGNQLYDIADKWITENILDKVDRVMLVQALITAVFKYACEDNQTFNNAKFLSVHKLVYKYVDSNEEYEVQAMYALIDLMEKWLYPQGLLLVLCEALSECNIISIDGFIAWEKSTDNRKGQGIAKKALASFLAELRENEESDEDEYNKDKDTTDNKDKHNIVNKDKSIDDNTDKTIASKDTESKD